MQNGKAAAERFCGTVQPPLFVCREVPLYLTLFVIFWQPAAPLWSRRRARAGSHSVLTGVNITKKRFSESAVMDVFLKKTEEMKQKQLDNGSEIWYNEYDNICCFWRDYVLRADAFAKPE